MRATLKMLTAVAFAVLVAGSSVAAREAPASSPQVSATPFHSNGCSGFREARFFSCCFVHDFAFWAGGNWADRRQADLALRRCVLDISNGFYANFAYFLVRLGTVGGAFVRDGWGRAWRESKRKRFAALTPEQRAQVDEERRRVCQALVLNPATGGYRVDERREIRVEQARRICSGASP